jgi:DNA topoisomerase-1
VHDRRLARIVKQCQEIPGQELFQYFDDEGKRHAIDSAAVNDYIKASAGGEYTAKDFRTWAATLLAARAFCELPVGGSNTKTKHNVIQAVEAVAHQLGNTPAVCRKCYIHTAIVDSYLDGSLAKSLSLPTQNGKKTSRSKLTAEERVILRWLRKAQRSVT